MKIYAIRMIYRLAGASSDVTAYFSTHPYAPKTADALSTMSPRVINPGSFENHMWRPGDALGRGVATYGYIELDNTDGSLDYLHDAAVDGRSVRIYSGNSESAFSTFTTLYQAVASSVTFTPNTVQLNIHDEMSVSWEQMINQNLYLGNNALPAGVEGSTELKGKYKPMVFGLVVHVTPPCVNTSQLIYQVSDNTVSNLLQVFNNGAAITPGVQRTTLATLLSNTPSAGTYDYFLGDATNTGCYFKLGSSPGNGIITFNAVQGFPSNYTAGRMVQSMMGYGLPYDDATNLLLTNNLPLFDSVSTINQGFYCGTEGVKLGDAVSAVASGMGATCVRNNAGKLVLVRLSDPSSLTSVYSFTANDMYLSNNGYIERLDQENNIPPNQVEISANRHWTILTGANVAGSVGDFTRADLAQEYRKAITNDTSVWDPVAKTGRHPLAGPLQVVSQIYDHVNDAPIEAARLISLYAPSSFKRRYIRFTTPKISLATTIDLGACVDVTFPRYGLTAKKMMVTGRLIDYQNERMDLYCWG